MSKTKYPSITKNFGDSFGPSPSHELPPVYPEPYYDDAPDRASKEYLSMPNATKLSRTEILENALANASSRVKKASSHLSILTEEQWRTLHTARTTYKDSGLQQLFLSMQRSYQENDEAFFKDYAQFYNTYRQAAKAYGLPLIKRSKV